MTNKCNLPLLSATVKILSLFAMASAFGADHFEILLPTQRQEKTLYLSRVHTDPEEADWRYFDELRSILERDLTIGGFAAILPLRPELEETLHWDALKKKFKTDLWNRQNVSFLLAIDGSDNRISVTAFDIAKQSAKTYPPLPLSRSLAADRKTMHRLADFLQKDLFGSEGIASLRILYAQREKNQEQEGLSWTSEIWICDADGEGARPLTQEKGYCLNPVFLPKRNGREPFLYVFHNEGQSKIFLSTLAHPEEKLPIVSLRGNQALVAASKTGKRIAFIADAAGRPDLFIQKFEEGLKERSKARQIFSAPRSSTASPTFSPDEKEIAFVSDKDGSPRIYALGIPQRADTQRRKPRLLTVKNRENTSPAWSPDGKKIAYTAKVDGIRQIWLYDCATGEESQLTFGAEMKENPAWAPDSIHLAYNTESDCCAEIYVLSILQKKPFLLVKGEGLKRFPCWETRECDTVKEESVPLIDFSRL